MLYISRFEFPDVETETDFRFELKMTCYDSIYPFGVLSEKGLTQLDFEDITLLCGGNGTGKTTALNIIAEKLKLTRASLYNRSCFFERYLEDCSFICELEITPHSRIITSDDVFDFMLDLRSLNSGVDRRRDELFDEYLSLKHKKSSVRSLEDYEALKRLNTARSKTASEFTRRSLPAGLRKRSNGESAFMYFQNKIEENALYLLDEPENSLSPEKQIELLQLIEDSARYFGCQFIIATHSAIMLSARNAKIYDFDSCPVGVCAWQDIPSVRCQYEFFRKHDAEFE